MQPQQMRTDTHRGTKTFQTNGSRICGPRRSSCLLERLPSVDATTTSNAVRCFGEGGSRYVCRSGREISKRYLFTSCQRSAAGHESLRAPPVQYKYQNNGLKLLKIAQKLSASYPRSSWSVFYAFMSNSHRFVEFSKRSIRGELFFFSLLCRTASFARVFHAPYALCCGFH